MAKKKKTTKKAKKKVKIIDLKAIAKDMKDYGATVMSDEVCDQVPYVLNFQHHGLNKITGGIPGGYFGEISGESQVSKSYLLYELMLDCIQKGGHCYLGDPEKAYQPSFGKRVGLVKGKDFIYSKEPDITKNFKAYRTFVKRIREVDEKCPILIGTDSFAGLKTKLDLDCEEALKDPKGYEGMRKNAVFSEKLSKFCDFIERYDVTYVLINQIRHDHKVTMGSDVYTLGENVIKFWATWRLQGLLGKKLVKRVSTLESYDKKKQVGVRTNWEGIKTRLVEPHQKCSADIIYRTGVNPCSGLDELLVNEDLIKPATKSQTNAKGKKLKTKLKGFKMLEGKKFYKSIESLVEENPEVLEPTRID